MRRAACLPNVLCLSLALITGNCSGTAPAAPDLVADTAPETITCADGLVLWEEYGVCAPRVDDCPNPWELPLIGGGCMAIGPRACPKAWDPDSDADCEPGQLLQYDGSACPEGFVLTEDEVACIPFFQEGCGEMEIPVLGGGCKKVGPDWGEEGEPYFDYCPDGHLALPGGGCVQVGPRACPKLWDADADVDCEVGDVLPCEEGWVESEDGLYCEPVYDECPFGERPLLGGGCERVIPLAKDCPPGPFPDVPEGVVDVVYVLADSTCVEDCGEEEAPYSSIGEAMDSASAGSYVAVGPGVYDEALVIEKSVHVAGLCAPLVVLTGLEVEDGEPLAAAAGIAVLGPSGVGLSGLSVVSPTTGLVILESEDFTLADISVSGSAAAAVYVGTDSSGTMHRLWLHDTVGEEDTGLGGIGLWVEQHAEVTIEGSLLESLQGAGILVDQAGTKVAAGDCAVRFTRTIASGFGGYGVSAAFGAVSLESVVLEGNRSAGLYATDGATVLVSRSLVRGTQPNELGQFGRGINVNHGCTVTVSESLLDSNAAHEMALFDPDVEVELIRSVVRGTSLGVDYDKGPGVVAQDGAALSVIGSVFEDNRLFGVQTAGPGTQVTLTGTVVRDTEPGGNFAAGIVAGSGSTLVVRSSLVEGNAVSGVTVVDPKTEAVMERTTIRATEFSPGGFGGLGVGVAEGGSFTLQDSLVEGNRVCGINAGHSGTQVSVDRSVIRDTLPGNEGEPSAGLLASEGAEVKVQRSCIQGNSWSGVGACDPGTEVTLDDSVVRDTVPGSALNGTGVLVMEGCTLTASRSLVEGNATAGISVAGQGSAAVVGATIVRGTVPGVPGSLGRGVEVTSGGHIQMSDCLLNGNLGIGLAAFESGTLAAVERCVVRGNQLDTSMEWAAGAVAWEGSKLTVVESLFEGNEALGMSIGDPSTLVEIEDSVVRQTKPVVGAAGSWGQGVMASGGSRLVVQRTLVEGNVTTGLGVVGSGTDVTMEGVVVAHSQYDQNGQFGMAVTVWDGPSLVLSHSLLADNTTFGVLAGAPGTDLLIQGSIVRGTQTDKQGELGRGLDVSQQARATVKATLFSNNNTAGVAAYDGGTDITLSDCAVTGTGEGGAWLFGEAGAQPEFQKFGDGVFAGEGSAVALSSVVVADNERCGAYYYGASGSIEKSVVSGNSSYGLALEACVQDVVYEEAGSVIFGNAHGLPAGTAADVTSNPKGLPVPPPPNISDMPRLPAER